MSVREKLREKFENNKGVFLSGEELANALGATRSGVWKAVNALRAEGYPIDAVPNRGYRLSEAADIISAAGIEKYLPPSLAWLGVETFDELPSTNSYLRERAQGGASEGLAVVASRQSGGRGRLGRSFFSPADTGLYLSLLLRPKMTADKAVLITTAAAVAVCRAIEALKPLEPGIKWVNDIFIGGKKVCGILTDAAFGMESGHLDFAVLGVGVNVYTPPEGFPSEISDIAGAVLDAPVSDARNRLAAGILESFMELYPSLEEGAFVAEYKRRSLVMGRRVSVVRAGSSIPAMVLDIDGSCRLRVRYDDGREESLSSGEISVRL